jgi:hypothetical protein
VSGVFGVGSRVTRGARARERGAAATKYTRERPHRAHRSGASGPSGLCPHPVHRHRRSLLGISLGRAGDGPEVA